jgi:aspartate/glutamate racemase
VERGDDIFAGCNVENVPSGLTIFAERNAVFRMIPKSAAEGILLGCTEIGPHLHEEDCPEPLFDTTKIHAAAAVEWALAV